MINISFAITACNEVRELDRLIKQLQPCLLDEDEVIIQLDKDNASPEMWELLKSHNNVIAYPLDKDFATFKNNVKNQCTKDYIFFIDADEEVTQDQIHLIREILEMNPSVDCYLVPRINTVAGLTPEHIGKWGWRVDEYNRINWPDYQFRLCKNKPEIKWVGKVHEKLDGYSQMAMLPAADVLALGHHKTIQKQERQNSFYNTL